MTFNWRNFWLILASCVVAFGWAFTRLPEFSLWNGFPLSPLILGRAGAQAQQATATQALNTALQNAIQQTARAQDIQIDLLGIYKSIPPAILAYVQEQQQIAAEKDQWWARQNAGMQQLLDAARAQAAKQ